MAAGGIRSLISGKSNFELVTEGSQFSYFIKEFKARPKFQCQMLPFPFEGTCHYGDTYTQTLPSAGDIIKRIYIKINLPNITPSVYATSIGNYLFEYVELLINREVVERCYGDFSQVMQEITVPQIKQPLLARLCGKDVSNLSGPIPIYIEIPFSMCERGIPMLAVAPGSFEIRIKYRASNEFTFPPVQITDFIDGQFLIDYVYLGPDEAKYFQDKKRIYLIQQTQVYQGTIDSGQTTVSYPLHFIGPVKEMFFIIKNQILNKYVFDYSHKDNNILINWSSVTFGNGVFVAVSSDGYASYSSDNGHTWIKSPIQSQQWSSVTFGNGIFVAVSSDGYASYSSDLTQPWTYSPIQSQQWSSVTFGNDIFVAVSSDGYASYSTDLTQPWTYSPIQSQQWSSITYSSIGYYMAVSSDGYASYSTDPTQPWTYSPIQSQQWSSVVSGQGFVVAVSKDGYASYSTDPTQPWTYFTNIDQPLVSITYSNGFFICVSSTGYVYSINSLSGKLTVIYLTFLWSSITVGNNGNLVIVSSDGYITYSLNDGQIWQPVNTNKDDNLINLQLMLDGYEVISQDIAVPLYLRGVQPMDFHTRIPTSTLFYMYSFCLDPENIKPTGHLNFGRIQQQILNMNVVESSQPRYVRVYARSYNIFTTEKGIGKLLFNSNG